MTPRPSLAVAIALVAACCARTSSDQVASDTAGRLDSVAGVAAASMDDAGVLGLLDAVNSADSAVGSMGAIRGRATEVKDFGRMITREHHAFRRDGQSLAGQLGLAPTAPRVPPDAPPPAMQEMLASDTSAAWDARYLAYAVAAHHSALENIARALAATRRPELRTYINTLVPIVQKHLDKAQSLERMIAGRAKAASAAKTRR